ncbi:hypothetical protein PFISCL1PPCAC_26809 [Pristionchus fissidentatus]|uniref:Uncharacterized protein n=1 Tax=Pristionchus fissidentatus TaxID=1538716 RepID=A0AAV5WU27_9BILA|nr:hypothetical protein PFISCL1PPCAC_26809 [Pristionchus fissidentatus]
MAALIRVVILLIVLGSVIARRQDANSWSDYDSSPYEWENDRTANNVNNNKKIFQHDSYSQRKLGGPKDWSK